MNKPSKEACEWAARAIEASASRLDNYAEWLDDDDGLLSDVAARQAEQRAGAHREVAAYLRSLHADSLGCSIIGMPGGDLPLCAHWRYDDSSISGICNLGHDTNWTARDGCEHRETIGDNHKCQCESCREARRGDNDAP